MKMKAINDLLGKAQLTPINPMYMEVDATERIENYFFENGKGEYRKESVDFMVKHKVDFHSTTNSSFDVAKRFVHVACPTCKTKMTYDGGTGSSITTTSHYHCSKCKTNASLTFPSDGITFSFKENRAGWGTSRETEYI